MSVQKLFLDHRNVEVLKSFNSELSPEGFSLVSDDYKDFLKLSNGGYFFGSSLHLFGISSTFTYHDITFQNTFIHELYRDLTKGLVFFGEDLFGNLYAMENGNYCLFNIETAERTKLALNFDGWLEIIHADVDYYTGRALLPQGLEKSRLSEGHRYATKVPIILGGDFKHDNLVVKKADENLRFNADIAHQVYGLPDGTKIKIKFK